MNRKIAFLTTVFPMKIQFLYDFFDSLINQTYKDFDIVVINDGYENFQELLSKYKTLNIIEVKYSNTIAKNREYGINYIINNNYDILIFGDSDDYFKENRIEKSIELLNTYNVVVNDLSLFDNNNIYIKQYISNRIKNRTEIDFKFIENKNIFGLSNTAVNVDILDKVFFDKDLIAVDWFLYKNLLRLNYKSIFTNETETYYRQYENNTIGLDVNNGIYPLWWENTNNIKENNYYENTINKK